MLTDISLALGAELGVRLHPGTGPAIHDRFQAAMVEGLLEILDARWRRFLEVAVRSPVRGVIDAVLHDEHTNMLVATEVQSEIRRLEQLPRWSQEKAGALNSADLFRLTESPAPPTISRLLLVRSTEATREIARRYEKTLAVAFPARATKAFDALSRPSPAWPGPALLWARVDDGRAEVLDRPPRGVQLGR